MKKIVALSVCLFIIGLIIGCNSPPPKEQPSPTESITDLVDELFEPEQSESTVEKEERQDIVYWVPNGEVWHTTPKCFF